MIDELIDQTFSHYRIVEKLGDGGMGVVYKAEDVKLGRFAALKFLPDEVAKDPQALVRFQLEAKAASALNHPNICTIYEVGDQHGQAFIAMEYLDGVTLRQRIAGKPIETDDLLVLAIGLQMRSTPPTRRVSSTETLSPPTSLSPSGAMPRFWILGWRSCLCRYPGLASKMSGPKTGPVNEQHLTSPGATVGTVAYMSPEQARAKELDARTDLFSFGAVLYEMATGQLPFRGDSTATIFEAILNRTPVAPVRLNPDLPAKLEDIITKALEKDRNLRYQSAADMRTDLQRVKRDTEGFLPAHRVVRIDRRRR